MLLYSGSRLMLSLKMPCDQFDEHQSDPIKWLYPSEISIREHDIKRQFTRNTFLLFYG